MKNQGISAAGPAVVAVFALVALWPPAPAVAGLIGVPDSVRPGAIRPTDDERQRIPQPPAEPVIEIPAMIDRPFDIDDGERVIVQRFEVTGAQDRPEHRIYVEQIKAILEEKRRERPDGFTIGRLEEAAAAVTSYYRERGLILAQAVIPVQTVDDDGVVEVEVLEGLLGRVVAEGNTMYDEAILQKPFRHLIGKPVTQAEVESALLTLTDFPGLSVFGVFQPGLRVGETDMVLQVQEEDRFDFAVRGDNHGTLETGEHRLRGTVDWNNITGGADRLSFTVQQTFSPRNNVFYSLGYERYLGRGFRAGAYITNNPFDVGGEFAARDIAGKTDFRGIFLDKTFIRSRLRNFSTRLDFATKRSSTSIGEIDANRDRLTVLTLGGTYDSIDTRFGGLNFATLEFTQGISNFLGSMGRSCTPELQVRGKCTSRLGWEDPNAVFASGSFSKLFGTYSRLQTITRHTSVLFRTEGQWSPDLLVPMEQYAIGGPENVRAYPIVQALSDQAAFVSAEYIINAPFIADQEAFGNRTWGELVQLSFFYDFAAGRLNYPFPTDPQGFVTYQGAGWSLRFNMPRKIESRFIMAWPIGGDEPQNDRTPQLWADFTYRF